MPSSAAAFSPDHLSPSDQFFVVHCNFCDTALAVSVPFWSLFTTVIVQCDHCSNLLSVNMSGLLLPAVNQLPKPPVVNRRTLANSEESEASTSVSGPTRSIRNLVYDPVYERVGLPMDPHLRAFLASAFNNDN